MSEPQPLNADDELCAVVAGAMKRLETDEREIIVQLFFLGRTFEEVSVRSGRQVHRLYTLYGRAIRKLRRCLQEYAGHRYGIASERPACPICDSSHCAEISALILNRDRTQSWAPILKSIRSVYGLDIRGPQRLMSHERYHMIVSDNSTK